MFVAGLEIDLQEFKKNRNRSLGVRHFSRFCCPCLAGMTLGRLFGYDWVASVLIRFAVGLSYPAGLPHCVCGWG